MYIYIQGAYTQNMQDQAVADKESGGEFVIH